MASREFDDRLEIEKLKGGEDWWQWKYSITLQLKAKKLWGHVDGTATLVNGTHEERENFEHSSIRTHALLVQGLKYLSLFEFIQ